MSGIEIAAVVLKTFPVLLKVANSYTPITEGAENWWSFKRTYVEFIAAIRTESISYKQNLQLLLSPLELDLEENGCLHKNPESQLWNDPTIRAQLRRQIPVDDFDWFMEQLRGMNTALGELFKLLPIRDGEVGGPYILNSFRQCLYGQRIVKGITNLPLFPSIGDFMHRSSKVRVWAN